MPAATGLPVAMSAFESISPPRILVSGSVPGRVSPTVAKDRTGGRLLYEIKGWEYICDGRRAAI
jgi:hypothetical protein